MSGDRVLAEVRALERADLETLRALWRERIGAVPKLRSADLLRRILAWKMQEQAYGGLTAETRRKLRSAGRREAAGPTLRSGSRLTREWGGQVHEVEVVEGGFVYDGERFASLSPIALHITGTRWNGPRFFGLRGGAQP